MCILRVGPAEDCKPHREDPIKVCLRPEHVGMFDSPVEPAEQQHAWASDVGVAPTSKREGALFYQAHWSTGWVQAAGSIACMQPKPRRPPCALRVACINIFIHTRILFDEDRGQIWGCVSLGFSEDLSLLDGEHPHINKSWFMYPGSTSMWPRRVLRSGLEHGICQPQTRGTGFERCRSRQAIEP